MLRAPTYTRRPDAEPLPAISGAARALRAGAAAAIAAAVAVPLLRRRARDPRPGDGRRLRRRAAGARRPAAALAQARRRPLRDADVGLHDGPRAALRRPGAPARAAAHPLPDRRSTARSASAGCPTPASSAPSPGCRGVGALDRFLTWVHWLWFLEPYLALLWILLRHPERFPRAARQMAAVFDLGCVVYFAVPTAPPWWASEQGLTGEEVRRIMVEVGEETWGSAWPAMYGALGGNPWAAMPSLHFATSTMAAISLAEAGRGRGRGRLGLRADARLRPRLPGRALRHRPARRRRPGRRGAARRAARRAGGPGGQPGPAAPGAPRQRVASLRVSPEGSANGGGAARAAALHAAAGGPDDARSSSSLLVAIYFLFPKLVGLGDALSKLGEADPVWIAVAIGFDIVAFATYIALFKAVVGGDVLPLTWTETYEINMAGARRDPALLGRRRRRHRAHLLGAAQGRDAAPRGRRGGWSPSSPSSTSSTRVALIVFGVLLRTGVAARQGLGRADDRPGRRSRACC